MTSSWISLITTEFKSGFHSLFAIQVASVNTEVTFACFSTHLVGFLARLRKTIHFHIIGIYYNSFLPSFFSSFPFSFPPFPTRPPFLS